MIGDTFNLWTVIGASEMRGKHRWWPCACKCGTKRAVRQDRLLSDQTKSCGCLWSEQHTRHGHASSKTGRSPEYRSWQAMLTRCRNSSHKHFIHYGGRGIRVCARWFVFENFLTDMGRKPTPKHTIERQDKNGNYCPENCCWVTQRDQTRNTRQNNNITAFGVTRCITDWALATGINVGTLENRFRKGWSAVRILTTPVDSSRSHRFRGDGACKKRPS